MKCYIFDIDGTLTNCEHRRHHVANKPKDWAAFNAAMEHDEPHPHMIRLTHCIGRDYLVVLCTGRNEEFRKHTEIWLDLHRVHYHQLRMRAAGDFRDDVIVKEEMLQQLRKDGYEPLMAFDDRDKVVAMWRENGVPCAQVAEGNF